MNLNHILNPIYQPQDVSILDLLEMYERATCSPPPKRQRSSKVASIHEAREVHRTNITSKTQSRYKAAFASKPCTINDIVASLRQGKFGIIRQLAKYRKATPALVLKTSELRGRQALWIWIGA